VGGEHFSSVAGSLPPHRGAVLKQRPQRFGRGCWSAVTLLSRVAGSLPPHRGAVLKQRPQHNLLCLFRARLLVGGDASFQRGGSFAAAPWRSF
jgi:hypothetical protein